MEAWDLYWITRLDGIKGFMVLGMVVFGVCSFVFALWGGLNLNDFGKEDNDYLKSLGKLKLIVPLFIFFLFGAILIPTSKEVMAFISVDYITHSDKVIDTADKLYEAVNKGLDGYLENKPEEGEK